MKGRGRFTREQADEIGSLLRAVRLAEPGPEQKLLREKLRGLGFYISDWGGGPLGFTALDFDELVHSGRITITLGCGDAPTGSSLVPDTRSHIGNTPRQCEPQADSLVDAACVALSRTLLAIPAATGGAVPNRPGLYALYGGREVWRELGLGEPPDRRPLYIGKAERSLESRDLKQHFATGNTGWSSPRRSFAALLGAAHVLDLAAMPRRPENPESKKWSCYALAPTDDGKLTDWMCSRLTIATWPSPLGTDLPLVERAVMQRWKPPLNLTGVATPWRTQVREARDALAERAREWAKERGFDV